MKKDQFQEYNVLNQMSSKFNSPFIVRIADALFSNESLNLIIDYCSGGSLRERINYHKDIRRPFKEEVFTHVFPSDYFSLSKRSVLLQKSCMA